DGEIVSAADAGAPHLRERIWIVAYSTRGKSGQQTEREGRKDFIGGSFDCRGIEEPRASSLAYPASTNAWGWSGKLESSQPANGESAQFLSDASGGSGAAAAGNNYAQVEYAAIERLSQPEPESRKQRRVEGITAIGTCAAGASWWATEPNVGRVANGVPSRVDRLKGLGNAVVPQIAQWIAERIKAVADFPTLPSAEEVASGVNEARDNE